MILKMTFAFAEVIFNAMKQSRKGTKIIEKICTI